jgi:hypothetical protein
MNTIKTHTSIRMIYWVTQILFWIFSIAALFGAFMGILILFNAFGNDLNLHVGLPTSFNIIEEGSLTIGTTQTNVKILEANGKINFIETPTQLRIIYGIFMIMVLSITFFLFYTFRKFISNVYKGNAFARSNIHLLKRISYGLLIFWGLIVSYTITQHFLVAHHLQFNTVEISGNMKFYPFVLLIALFLWVLSHIFMHGSQLEEESNLTI